MLNVDNNRIITFRDLKALPSLTSLTSLHLNSCRSISDFTFLRQCAKLEVLDIGSNDHILSVDLNAWLLADDDRPTLRSLNVRSCRRLEAER